MATIAREVVDHERVSFNQLEPTPVILDCGEDVRIVVLRFAAPLRVGDMFALDGTTWEIVRAKDHTRGCVARSLPEPTS
jgi:Lhr-like helicase